MSKPRKPLTPSEQLFKGAPSGAKRLNEESKRLRRADDRRTYFEALKKAGQ